MVKYLLIRRNTVVPTHRSLIYSILNLLFIFNWCKVIHEEHFFTHFSTKYILLTCFIWDFINSNETEGITIYMATNKVYITNFYLSMDLRRNATSHHTTLNIFYYACEYNYFVEN